MALTHYIGGKIVGTTADFDLPLSVNYPELTTFINQETFIEYILVAGVWTKVGNPLMVATGGAVTEDGDFKVHTFNGDGTFQVISTSAESNTVEYLIIGGGAGGGSGGSGNSGGGGAGGFRTATDIGVVVQPYPIVVGAGGAFAGTVEGNFADKGESGGVSSFNSIESAGGGGGSNTGGFNIPNQGNSGGSGGGGGQGVAPNYIGTGGAGDVPDVTPDQGSDGGTVNFDFSSAGGGGASQVGGNPTSGGAGSKGGDGSISTISGSSVTYAGGGGGATHDTSPGGNGGAGGLGGGGTGKGFSGSTIPATDGDPNSGGGGGGGGQASNGGNGGSGVVILRYRFK